MKNLFKISLTIIICLCLTMLFSTCKKYPEDGKHSWHKPEKRIQQKWELKECWLDEEEKTFEQFTSISSCDSKTFTTVFSLNKLLLEFDYSKVNWYGNKKDYYSVNYSITDIQSSVPYSTSTCAYPKHGTSYRFVDKKRKLQFGEELFVYSNSGINTFFKLNNNPWDIIKLTETEFTIETMNTDNKKVRLKFNKL